MLLNNYFYISNVYFFDKMKRPSCYSFCCCRFKSLIWFILFQIFIKFGHFRKCITLCCSNKSNNIALKIMVPAIATAIKVTKKNINNTNIIPGNTVLLADILATLSAYYIGVWSQSSIIFRKSFIPFMNNLETVSVSYQRLPTKDRIIKQIFPPAVAGTICDHAKL